jgi:hypothetical protein
MTTPYQNVYDEAGELFRKNRCYDAAVLFQQARQIAKEYSLSQEAATAGVWAAISWHGASHPLKAYSLLLDILSTADTDLDIMDRWRARKRVFCISISYSPELDKLERNLEKLRLFQQEYPELPIADLHQNTGDLLRSQGRWQEALAEYELAWSEYNDCGYLKFWKASSAGFCNLRLGKPDSAQRWCDRLGETETDWPSSRIAWYNLQGNLALYQENWHQAEQHAIQAEKKADLVQEYEFAIPALDLRVRTLLLQPDLGDPADTNHPARFRLRQRFSGKIDVYNKYNQALLLADYRLASIRYSAGVLPVDDYWYRQPQQVPSYWLSGFQEADFQLRKQLARRGINRAMVQAKYLDNCFRCTWRQAEVQQRFERLEQLIRIVNKSP